MATRNVTVTLLEQDTTPVVGAKIMAKLNHTDVDAGYLHGDHQEFTSDVNGQAVMPLWPNELGATSSRYHVTARHPTAGRKILDVMATIPDADCNLDDVAELPAFPGKPEGGIAAANAAESAIAAAASEAKSEQWAEEVEDTEVEVGKYSSLHHSAKANAQRVLAEAAKDTSVSAAGSAGTSAGQASDSATAAGDSEAKAQKWAEEVEDTEVEPGKYSALHHASKAQQTVAPFTAHLSDNTNPHSVTASQVGLGNAENKDFATGVPDAVAVATSKAAPVDDDELGLVDSEASYGLKRLTWANLKAAIKTYYDSVTATLTNKTLTAPDINGGTGDDLTSLSVAADSDGNVSRFVRTLPNGDAATTDYWTKIAEFTGAGGDCWLSKTLLIQTTDLPGGNQSPNTLISLDIKDATGGMVSASTEINVLHGTTIFGRDNFKLVQATASGGVAIELWCKASVNYGTFNVFEIAATNKNTFTSDYSVSSAWQSATPTGAVVVTSDYAGSAGVVESGSNSNGEYVKYAYGTMICTEIKTKPSREYLGGAIIGSTEFNWTFPAAFVAEPSVAAKHKCGWVYDFYIGHETMTASDISSAYTKNIGVSTRTTSITLHLSAIGRWK